MRTRQLLVTGSNETKMTLHYPRWSITKSLDDIFRELVEAWMVWQ